jgi:alpha-D-ribose 1-methylphosphonate 5-phosphate C-P lyase
LFAEGRTLTFEKFKYAFESWWQTPAIAGGEFLQLMNIVMRDEGSKVG